MYLELKEVVNEGEPRSIVAAAGQTIQVGRLKLSNHLCIPDPVMAPVHFSIAFDGAEGQLKDLNHGVQKHAVCAGGCFAATLRNSQCHDTCRLHDRSGEAGVYLNGTKVPEARLKDGDVLVAGSTAFLVAIGEAPPQLPLSPPKATGLTLAQQAKVLDVFARQKLPVFALLDAARSPRVLQTLRVHSELFYSLYDGPDGEVLDEVAPYLVQLQSRSPLLEALVREHWSESWGVFLWALTDLKALRRHLRRSLMVQDAKGKDMYFRFYDPRVLCVFLPTCTPAELAEFFGPIAAFLIESGEPAHAWLCTHEPGYSLRVDDLAF
jgi:pSer/pThr/pTyr-binding forkhead associated (FHA) protein